LYQLKAQIEARVRLSAKRLMVYINGKLAGDGSELLVSYGWKEGDEIAVAVDGNAPDAQFLSVPATKITREYAEYAYLQPDEQYLIAMRVWKWLSKKQKKNARHEQATPLQKPNLRPRCVDLREGTKVHTSQDDELARIRHRERPRLRPMLLRSCLKRSSTLGSNFSVSTADSVTDHRRVHFADGLMPRCDESMRDSVINPSTARNLLANWDYVDRDICGLSVFESTWYQAQMCHFDTEKSLAILSKDWPSYQSQEKEFAENEEKELDEHQMIAKVNAVINVESRGQLPKEMPPNLGIKFQNRQSGDEFAAKANRNLRKWPLSPQIKITDAHVD
jgi:hypothetical protein